MNLTEYGVYLWFNAVTGYWRTTDNNYDCHHLPHIYRTRLALQLLKVEYFAKA